MSCAQFEVSMVEFVPETLREGVLYVSMTYMTSSHLCACGCRREVVTPLSPRDWSISIRKERATLRPSIGNWSFPCRSHYWIIDNQVRWAGDMPDVLVQRGREISRQNKERYYSSRKQQADADLQRNQIADKSRPQVSFWRRIMRFFGL